MRYLATLEELLHTLAQVKDYSDLHTCASHALQVKPNNLCALYWLIVSTYHQGARSSAKELLKEAEMNLSSNEYTELKHYLKKRDGLPWFYREFAAQQ